MYRIVIWIILGFSASACNQTNTKILKFKSHDIEIVQRTFETDTTFHAYFDEKIPRVTKTQHSNSGTYERDLTIDSIAQLIWEVYPKIPISPCDFGLNEPDFNPDSGILDNVSKDTKIRDTYFEKAINHYYQKSKTDTQDYRTFYNLALAWAEYKGLYNTNEKIIQYLEQSIKLSSSFEDSYLLKAKAHEQAGLFKGMIASDPNVNAINWHEIELANLVIEKGLSNLPESKRLLALREELKNKYDIK